MTLDFARPRLSGSPGCTAGLIDIKPVHGGFTRVRRPLHHAKYAMAMVLTLGVGIVGAAEPIPLAAFFGPPEIGAVALSPSGTTLLLTVPGKNQRMELVAADMERQPLRFTSLAWLTDYDVANAYWLNDKRLVFDVYDSQAGEWAGITGLWAVDADGENGRMLIDPYWGGFRAAVPGNRNILPNEWALHSIPRDGSDDVLVVERGWSSFRSAATAGLARLNTHIPRPVRLSTSAPEGTQRWFTDEHGDPQVVEALLDGKRRIYRRGNDAAWQELASFDASVLAGWVPRFVLDGQLFVASEAAGASGMQLRLWDTAAGALLPEAVLTAKGFDVGSNAEPIVDSPGGQLLGWRYRLDTIYTRWIEPAMAGIQASIDRALPGRVNVIQCNPCLGAKRLLVVSYSDREPPAYAVLERGTGKLTSNRFGSSGHPGGCHGYAQLPAHQGA